MKKLALVYFVPAIILIILAILLAIMLNGSGSPFILLLPGIILVLLLIPSGLLAIHIAIQRSRDNKNSPIAIQNSNQSKILIICGLFILIMCIWGAVTFFK
jgi:hypothetical protein